MRNARWWLYNRYVHTFFKESGHFLFLIRGAVFPTLTIAFHGTKYDSFALVVQISFQVVSSPSLNKGPINRREVPNHNHSVFVLIPEHSPKYESVLAKSLCRH